MRAMRAMQSLGHLKEVPVPSAFGSLGFRDFIARLPDCIRPAKRLSAHWRAPNGANTVAIGEIQKA